MSYLNVLVTVPFEFWLGFLAQFFPSISSAKIFTNNIFSPLWGSVAYMQHIVFELVIVSGQTF